MADPITTCDGERIQTEDERLRAEVERLRIDRDSLLLVLGWSRRNGPCSEVSMHQAMIAETKEAMEQRRRAEKAEAELVTWKSALGGAQDEVSKWKTVAEKAEAEVERLHTCKLCQDHTAVHVARLAEAEALLREARPLLDYYDDRVSQSSLGERVDAYLAACDGQGEGGG